MRSRWFGFIVVALLALFTLWIYGRLPAVVPSHWNLRGEVNGHAPRWAAGWIVVLAILVLRLALGWLPRIDPLGKNYAAFSDTYWTIVNLVLLFMAVAHALVLLRAAGSPIASARLVPLGVGLALALLGNILGRVRPNWFVGVRTPWTLSSETVWRRTHRATAWIFVAGGLAELVSGALPTPGPVPWTFGILAITALIPVVYSYILWRSEQRGHS